MAATPCDLGVTLAPLGVGEGLSKLLENIGMPDRRKGAAMRALPIDSRLGPARAEPGLSLVPAAAAGERARELLRQARTAALEQLAALAAAVAHARDLARSVAEGGADLYGPGPQDLAARLADDLTGRLQTLQALTERRGGRRP
jgi:hypothetical protein